MRPGQSNKRGRGRGGRKGPSPLSRSYESNGPDVKIRGTAQHIADKYVNLARDAQSSGDTVLSQAYLQYAEHFYRVVAAAQEQMNQTVRVKRADDPLDSEDGDERGDFDPADPNAPQPDANADGNQGGNGRDDNRRDRDRDRNRDDDDGRSRRNRGRQRRGRGDDDRDGPRADGPRSDDRDGGRRDEERSDTAEAPKPAPAAEVAEAAENGSATESGSAAEVTAPVEEKPRRAPRKRKQSVDVADRFEGDDAPAQAAKAPEPPKPVTLGDEVAPVQAAPEDS